MEINLRKRTAICRIQVFAKKFKSYPILSRIGIKVKNKDGSYMYLNHNPKTDWDAELLKCAIL